MADERRPDEPEEGSTEYWRQRYDESGIGNRINGFLLAVTQSKEVPEDGWNPHLGLAAAFIIGSELQHSAARLILEASRQQEADAETN